MNRPYITIILLLVLLCSGCNNDNEETIATIKPEATGSFVDARDQFTYHWVKYNGLDWTVENSHYKTSDGTYGIYIITPPVGTEPDIIDAETFEKYGYLYNYDALSEVAPEGWRVPTDEDWKKLEEALGISQEEANQTNWRGSYAGKLLTQDQSGSGLNFLYGGYWNANSASYSSKFRLIKAEGLYWTSTKDETKNSEKYAYYRKIRYNSNQIFRYSTDTSNMFSIRFVRNSN